MKYCVNLEPNKLNCFSENHWTEHNNWDVLKHPPFSNQLLESELDDLTFDDLVEIDGKIEVDLEKYHSNRHFKEEEKLRNRRNHLLTGWDKYASNVAFGVYVVSQSDKETMIAWYHGLLDLKEDAINNPPSIIKYLIGEKPLENDIIVKGG